MLALICTFLLASYIIAVAYLYFNWAKIQTVKESNYQLIPIAIGINYQLSVVVAAKNEAQHIVKLLKSLAGQSLEKSYFEIIIVDDHSTDNTFDLVIRLKNQEPEKFSNLQIIRSAGKGKKAALKEGITISKGNIIICTDGDCEVKKNWLRSYLTVFEEKNAKFVFGPVTFINDQPKTFLNRLAFDMQSIEFASLVGSGAASWKAGTPNMCNGANIAYSKDAFIELNGFEGNENIASGDDEFLLHKVFTKHPVDVYFLKNQDSIVYTQPSNTFKEFFNQRIRWASKWEHYQDWKVKTVAFYIFLTNLLTIYALISLISDMATTQKLSTINYQLSTIILLRWIAEYMFLKDVLRFMDKRINLWAFLQLVLIYPFYVVLFGLSGRVRKTVKKDDRS